MGTWSGCAFCPPRALQTVRCRPLRGRLLPTLDAMNTTTSIALSGMNAAQAQLGASAHNIANQATLGFKRQTVQVATVPEGGVKVSLATAPQAGNAPEADMVAQLQAKSEFMANLAVFKAQDRMIGALVDARI